VPDLVAGARVHLDREAIRSEGLRSLVARLVHFLGQAVDGKVSGCKSSFAWDAGSQSFVAPVERLLCWYVGNQVILTKGLVFLRELPLNLHLSSHIQLAQVLTFLRLNCLPIELSELRSSQGDDLVPELGRLLQDWVPQHLQVGEMHQRHQHRGHLLLKVKNLVVVQVECDQVLTEVKRLAVDEVHVGQIQHSQSI